MLEVCVPLAVYQLLREQLIQLPLVLVELLERQVPQELLVAQAVIQFFQVLHLLAVAVAVLDMDLLAQAALEHQVVLAVVAAPQELDQFLAVRGLQDKVIQVVQA